MFMGSRFRIRHHEKSDKLEYFPSHLLRGYVERTLTHLALIYFFMYEVCKCLIAMRIIISMGSTCKLGISIEEDGKKGIKD